MIITIDFTKRKAWVMEEGGRQDNVQLDVQFYRNEVQLRVNGILAIPTNSVERSQIPSIKEKLAYVGRLETKDVDVSLKEQVDNLFHTMDLVVDPPLDEFAIKEHNERVFKQQELRSKGSRQEAIDFNPVVETSRSKEEPKTEVSKDFPKGVRYFEDTFKERVKRSPEKLKFVLKKP